MSAYEKQDDAINPKHYSERNPEPIDVIISWGLSFCLGNVVKYIARAPHKNNELQDLKKAAWYLDHEIEQVESRVGKSTKRAIATLGIDPRDS